MVEVVGIFTVVEGVRELRIVVFLTLLNVLEEAGYFLGILQILDFLEIGFRDNLFFLNSLLRL